MTYVFLCLGLISSALFISVRKPQVTLKVAFLKAVSSVLFILTAIFALVENSSCSKLVGGLIVAGGVWGLLGDISLDLKYVFKQEEKQLLNAGFISFLIGHIFYLVSYIIAFGYSLKGVIFAVVGFVVACAAVSITEPIFKVKYGKFKPITSLYIGVLGLCLGLNLGYAFDMGFKKINILLCVGLALFLLSDVLLSGLYFGQTEKDKNNRTAIIFNHIFYYAAQFMLATSILLY